MLRDYWNGRYDCGGNSGHGSIGRERIWKWNIIREYIVIASCSVVDIGCGDLSFWGSIRAKSYIGIDYSDVVIEQNRTKFPDLIFHREDLTETKVAIPPTDAAFCFDVLFHQPSECDFLRILGLLNSLNARVLFVSNFDYQLPRSGGHMSYRVLERYLENLDNWLLLKIYDSPIDTKRLYVLVRL